ncbi:lytic transglycosylase domain-containing protein [Peredibacter sp. HCB2-198]|uniref:lytic transglycosylase domain-containing protein n=1 Tax=Peredibacter sp. HCB2-198 TaxID=3383025 RepID=UPI0038B4A4C8
MKFAVIFLFLFIPEAAASHRMVRDNKISKSEADTLAERARRNTKFPIVVNDQVLKQLNRLLGRPSGRKHMLVCLKRMRTYKPLITKKLNRHKLPHELLAVPLVESGYQNIHSEQGWGSGLWMFVKPTAKSFGLKVNDRVDQRLNVKLSTEAALKYLRSNHKMFKDWQLALLAYNMGEYRTKAAIKSTKSRNAWTLIRKGHHGDKEYLAKVMAVMIIMKNQNVLH